MADVHFEAGTGAREEMLAEKTHENTHWKQLGGVCSVTFFWMFFFFPGQFNSLLDAFVRNSVAG